MSVSRTIEFPFGVMALVEGDCCADFILSKDEFERYCAFSAKKRQQDFLRGRSAAKIALEKFCELRRISFPDKALVTIDSNENGVPCARGFSVGISISHSRDIAVAIAFDLTYSCGIDVEFFRENRIAALSKMSSEEIVPRDLRSMTIAWSAKEALSKALGTGLTIALHKLRISKWLPNVEFALFPNMQFIVIPDSVKIIAIVYGKIDDVAQF